MNEESLFAAARKMPNATERQAFLDQACAGDPALRQRVEQLLAAHEQARTRLDLGSYTASQPGGIPPASPAEPPLMAEQPFAGFFRLWEALGDSPQAPSSVPNGEI